MNDGPVSRVSKPIETSTAELVAGLIGERSVVILDAGARWGAEGAWWSIPPLARLIGFEPDTEECARLNEKLGPDAAQRFEPIALGRHTGDGVLHVTSDPACSSLYPPDEALVARYPDLRVMAPARTARVPLVAVDDWSARSGIGAVGFVKLDTQGSELDILSGAERTLRDCVGLEVEVEFTPLYHGAAVFSDVDLFLRERGFALWRLESLCHYAEAPVRGQRQDVVHSGGVAATFPIGSGRLFWANAIYFRDYAVLSAESDDERRRLLVLAALLAASGDLAGGAAALRRAAPGLGGSDRAAIERHAAALWAAEPPQAAIHTKKRRRSWWRRLGGAPAR